MGQRDRRVGEREKCLLQGCFWYFHFGILFSEPQQTPLHWSLRPPLNSEDIMGSQVVGSSEVTWSSSPPWGISSSRELTASEGISAQLGSSINKKDHSLIQLQAPFSLLQLMGFFFFNYFACVFWTFLSSLAWQVFFELNILIPAWGIAFAVVESFLCLSVCSFTYWSAPISQSSLRAAVLQAGHWALGWWGM